MVHVRNSFFLHWGIPQIVSAIHHSTIRNPVHALVRPQLKRLFIEAYMQFWVCYIFSSKTNIIYHCQCQSCHTHSCWLTLACKVVKQLKNIQNSLVTTCWTFHDLRFSARYVPLKSVLLPCVLKNDCKKTVAPSIHIVSELVDGDFVETQRVTEQYLPSILL